MDSISPLPDDLFDCVNPDTGDLFSRVSATEIAGLICDNRLTFDSHARIHGTEEWLQIGQWFPPPPPPIPPPTKPKPGVEVVCPRCLHRQVSLPYHPITALGWLFIVLGTAIALISFILLLVFWDALLFIGFVAGAVLAAVGSANNSVVYHCGRCRNVF